MLKRSMAVLALLGVMGAPAWAAEVVTSHSVERVVTVENENGDTVRRFVPAEDVTPGDELKYSVKFENIGADTAENINLVMPVPAEVVYIEQSTVRSGASVSYSADGGKTFAARGDLTVTVEGQERRAVAENITHVRWIFDSAIAPGEEGQVGFRAMLK